MRVAPDTAAFRAVLDSVFASPAYRWAEEPGLLTTLRDWWQRLGAWLHGLQVGNPLAFRVVIAALLLVLLLIIAHGAYVAYQTLRGAVQAPSLSAARPVVEAQSAVWYEREADRAAAEGRLLEALQLAFAALARRLDAQGLLRYQPSMTPAECARAARLTDADRVRLRTLVATLYGHVFGGTPCAVDDYVRWRAASVAPWQQHAAAH